jgi:hypothetical protein
VIDKDLGRSAAGGVQRAGFERMVAQVCLGKVGAVTAREVSRFARNSRDWQQLTVQGDTEFCKELSMCSRGHSVFHEDKWFNVYCFAEVADAEKFMQRFGGEKFDPKQRGRGSNWARWKK